VQEGDSLKSQAERTHPPVKDRHTVFCTFGVESIDPNIMTFLNASTGQ
jgi:hypothetical protein